MRWRVRGYPTAISTRLAGGGAIASMADAGIGKSVLVVDDDVALLGGYRRGFSALGFAVWPARTIASAMAIAKDRCPELAIIDLKLGCENGLVLVEQLKNLHPTTRIVVVSGYLSVATTVRAIRTGAELAIFKPATCAEIAGMLLDDDHPPGEVQTPTLARAEWEHMMRVLDECDGNITHAARRLGLHRQNLQRRLRKLAPS
jgi:two-component system response regulator RegA